MLVHKRWGEAGEKLENWSGRIFGGHWIEGRGGEVAIVEPATGDNIGLIGVATAADVDDATARASSAQHAWNLTPFNQRAAILHEPAALLKARADRFIRWNSVFQVLPGAAETGDALLTRWPNLSGIAFARRPPKSAIFSVELPVCREFVWREARSALRRQPASDLQIASR